MSALDIAFILILLVSVGLGVWRGLVFEVLSIFSWVWVFFVAQWAATPWADALFEQALDAPARYGLAMVLVWLLAAALAVLSVWAIRRAGGRESLIEPISRILGAIIGLLRGVLILLTLASVVHLSPAKQAAFWRASTGALVLTHGFYGLQGMLPQNLLEHYLEPQE